MRPNCPQRPEVPLRRPAGRDRGAGGGRRVPELTPRDSAAKFTREFDKFESDSGAFCSRRGSAAAAASVSANSSAPATHLASLDPRPPPAASAPPLLASLAAGQQPLAPPRTPQLPRKGVERPRRPPATLRKHVLDRELESPRGQVAAPAGTPLRPWGSLAAPSPPLFHPLSQVWVGGGGPALSRGSPPPLSPARSVSAGGPTARGAALAAAGGAAGLHQSSPVGESLPRPRAISGAWAVTLTRSNVARVGGGKVLWPAAAEGWGAVTGGRGRGGLGCFSSPWWQEGEKQRHAESRIRSFYVQGAFAQGAHISPGREDPGVTFPEL